MREILFKAKHIHALSENEHLNGRWIYGYLCSEDYINSPELRGEFLIDKNTICQYTGLTDKNGKRIWENDIVKTSKYGKCDENGHNFAGFDTFVVRYDDGGFALFNNWRRFNLRDNPMEYEAVGNVFDDTELLRED